MSKCCVNNRHCVFLSIRNTVVWTFSPCSLFLSVVEVVLALILVVFSFTDSSAHSGPDSGPGRTDGPGDPHQASCCLCASCGLLSWRHHPASYCRRHQCGYWSGPENRWVCKDFSMTLTWFLLLMSCICMYVCMYGGPKMPKWKIIVLLLFMYIFI